MSPTSSKSTPSGALPSGNGGSGTIVLRTPSYGPCTTSGFTTELLVTVGNQGDGPSEPIDVAAFLVPASEPRGGGVPLGRSTIDRVPSGSEGKAEMQVTIPPDTFPGTYVVRIALDPHDAQREYDEENNTADGLVRVTEAPPGPAAAR